MKFEIRTFVTDWPVAHLHGILYAYRSLVHIYWMNRTFVTDWPVAHLHGILYAYRSLVRINWMNP